MATRVLPVEALKYFGDGLALLFDRRPEFEVVGWAGSVAEGRACVGRSNGIDVALIDLLLPDGNGIDLLEDVPEAEPGVNSRLELPTFAG